MESHVTHGGVTIPEIIRVKPECGAGAVAIVSVFRAIDIYGWVVDVVFR